jgi:RNA polymerase sigma factor (sigma-70 family)
MTSAALDAILEVDFPAAQRGDHDAFARLVRATQRMVASVALAVTRDVPLSEDIAQETYLIAWQKLAAMTDRDSFLPWLRQVARNRAIDQLRKRRYAELTLEHSDQRMAAVADEADPMDARKRAEQRELLAGALDEIPEDSREVLLLFYREGQSSRNVAELLGMSDGAVRKRLQRAREGLHAELLHAVGEVALRSAPGIAFTSSVLAPLAAGPGVAHATGAAAAGSTGKWLLGALGSVFAALGLVLAAVAWDVRIYLKKARNPAEHRALLQHGVVYGALMASYIGMLFWSKHANWSFTTTLRVSVGYSVAIFWLAMRRIRILRRHRPKNDSSHLEDS